MHDTESRTRSCPDETRWRALTAARTLSVHLLEPATTSVREFRRPTTNPNLPNVPPLSSGRISKTGGHRWRRASPWYSTTGEREALMFTTRRGRLLQRLVGQRQ